MYFESFLPFLEERGRLIRNKKEIVNMSEVYCPLSYDKSLDDIDKDIVVRDSIDKKVIKIFHILPINVKVLVDTDSMSVYLKRKWKDSNVRADVTYIDYSDVARSIEYVGDKAFISKNGANLMHEGVLTDYFINCAANNIVVDINNLGENSISIPIKERVSVFNLFSPSKKVNEELTVDDLFAAYKKKGKLDFEVHTVDYIYSWLDGYFNMPEGQDGKDSNGREVVPLLIGPTGVFKSATIKELCKKYDFRLIDFRVTFTSRLDYSGLYNKVVLEDGSDYSYACPMEELVTVSDGFREYCRKAIEKIKETLKRGTLVVSKSSSGSGVVEDFVDMSEEQVDKLNGMLKDYQEYVKTPVLFFDEITRNKNKGVEGVLVQMLNQKRFGNMTMYGCKFVAATNLNLTYEEINDIYDVNEDLDMAFSNRFMPFKVFPEDVRDRWFYWANDKGKQENTLNIHPVITSFLKDNLDSVYDERSVVDVYVETGDAIEAAATPYPNYRTWDMLSTYLYARDKDNKEINVGIIESLIGKGITPKIVAFLLKNGFKEETIAEDTDDVGKFLEDNLEAGLPALLIGPSSLGKTARVNNYAKKIEKRIGLKPEIIHINLASLDNVDVMGMPVKKALTTYVAGDVRDSNFKILNKELKGIIEEIRMSGRTGLVDTLTVRAPDMSVKERFLTAMREGRMIILFFDECNRVTNSSIMSAMFEAISDYRIFGIDYKDYKDNVRVIAACNLGEDYSGAQGLDPALTARFSTYWKKAYDLRDVESFLSFLESKVGSDDSLEQVDGLLIDYLRSLDKNEVLHFLKKVEVRQIENAEPSSRMLFQLCKDIKNMRGNKNSGKSVFNGTLLFNAISSNNFAIFAENLSNVNDRISRGQAVDINDVIQEARELIKYISANSTRWDALYNNRAGRLESQNVPASKLLELLNTTSTRMEGLISSSASKEEVLASLSIIRNLIDTIRGVDREVVNLRSNIFEAYAGPEFTKGFLPYFNERFGTEDDVEITLDMLDDINLIDNYFARKVTDLATVSIDSKVMAYRDLIVEFWNTHGDSLPAENYARFFNGIKSGVGTSDNVLKMFEGFGNVHDMFLQKAESVGDSFIKEALRGVIVVNDTLISQAKSVSGENVKVVKAKLL